MAFPAKAIKKRLIVEINVDPKFSDKDVARLLRDRLNLSFTVKPYTGIYRSGINVKSYSRVKAAEEHQQQRAYEMGK